MGILRPAFIGALSKEWEAEQGNGESKKEHRGLGKNIWKIGICPNCAAEGIGATIRIANENMYWQYVRK